MKEFTLKGILAPIVTPYTDDGRVDYEAQKEIASYILASGVNGILVGGTNGEFANLTMEERVTMLEELRNAFSEASLLFNVSALNPEGLGRYIAEAKKNGADAITSTAPYFHHYDDNALFLYFSYIAEKAGELPVYLYNIPGMSGNPLSASLVKRLAEKYENIRGIKDSSMDLMTLIGYRAAVRRDDFEISTGNDAIVMHSLLSGADGGVIASASVFPSLASSMYRAWKEGNTVLAMEKQNLIMEVRSLFRSVMPIMAHKEALALQGYRVGGARLPLRNLTNEEKKKVKDRLEELELI